MSSLKEMTKEDLELLSNKEITNLLLEENGKMNTADLYKEIIRLLELPSSTFDAKIGDYYTSLTTDKRFILLEDGLWDLRSRHTSDKAIIPVNDDDEEEDLELDEKEDWARLMKKINRKTLVVCKDCHSKIHKIKLRE